MSRRKQSESEKWGLPNTKYEQSWPKLWDLHFLSVRTKTKTNLKAPTLPTSSESLGKFMSPHVIVLFLS